MSWDFSDRADDLSTCGLAYDTEFHGADRFNRSQRHLGTGPLTTSHSFHAVAGREYLLRQFSSLVPQALHSQPHM